MCESLSCVQLFVTLLVCPWDSLGIMLKWVAVSFPRDLPNPGIEPGSPTLQADFLPSELPGKPQLRDA